MSPLEEAGRILAEAAMREELFTQNRYVFYALYCGDPALREEAIDILAMLGLSPQEFLEEVESRHA